MVLASCTGGPRSLAEGTCPAAFAPAVTARIEPGAVVRNDLKMAEMRRDAVRVLQASGNLAAPSAPLKHYFGQSFTRTRLDARLVTEAFTLADGRSCVVPQRVDLVLRFTQREVRVATETHDDACLREEVEQHEMRHVALDDEMIAAFGPVLQARARLLAATLRGAEGINAADAKARLAANLRTAVRGIYDEFEASRHWRHLTEIDTPEEYARVKTICDGRARRLVSDVS
jgi:hypothetical protein